MVKILNKTLQCDISNKAFIYYSPEHIQFLTTHFMQNKKNGKFWAQ